MIDSFTEILILAFFSIGVGIFVSTSSGTAGTLLIPFLTLVFGYSTYDIIGTSLAVDCMIGISASIIYLKHKNIEIKSAIYLVIFGVIGAIIGSQFTSSTPEIGLKSLIGFVLIFIGINFVINGVQKNLDFFNSKINFAYLRKNKTLSFSLLGIIIGIVSGFIGLGSSRMMAVVLIFVIGYRFHQAIGTSMIMMVFVAGTGAVSHSLNGNINLNLVAIAGIGAAIGALIGSTFAHRINEEKLARFAGMIITGIGLFMIIKTFFYNLL